jgi:LIVCS family branched-chain amino acid:cation transporter
VVFSGVFATVGVTTIVTVAVPLLVTTYPVAICLIILTLMGRAVAHRAIYAGAVIGALSTSVFEALTAAEMPIAIVNTAISYIPLANAGFAWIVPGLIGALVGMALARAGIGSPIPTAAEVADDVKGAAVAAE